MGSSPSITSADKPIPDHDIDKDNRISCQSSMDPNSIEVPAHAVAADDNAEDDCSAECVLLLAKDVTTNPFPKLVNQKKANSKVGIAVGTASAANESQSTKFGSHDPHDSDDAVTYLSLIRDNVPYRLYLASYVTNYFGDWLTYLSSLSALRVMLTQSNTGNNEDNFWQQHPQTLISYVVVVRLMTSASFAPFGGVVADWAWDRRHVMIVLDLCGAAIAWLYVLAAQVGMEAHHQQALGEENEMSSSASTNGIVWIFVATFLQQAITSGLYEPSRSALLPSLLMQPLQPPPANTKTGNRADSDAPSDNDKDASKQQRIYRESLEKATIISGIAWSTVAALGSSTGGFLVSQLGVRLCFIADSVTYLLSALLMYYCARLDSKGGEYQRVTATTVQSCRAVDTTAESGIDGDRGNEMPKDHKQNDGNQTGSNPTHGCSSLFGSSSVAEVNPCLSLQYLYYKAKAMAWDGIHYTFRSVWGALVFMKFSILWLTMDVPNIKFASRIVRANWTVAIEDENDVLATPRYVDTDDSVTEEEKDAFRLGLLFTGVGVGCFLGPLIVDRFTSIHRPQTLQLACITCLGFAALACLAMGGMAIFVPDYEQYADYTASSSRGGQQSLPDTHLPWPLFGGLCVLTSLRAMGVSAAWMNSELLLRTLSCPQMLGRVSSLDIALAYLGESASAMLSGRLEDDYGWSPFQICQGLGLWGLVLWTLWMVFHFSGKGAAATTTTLVTSYLQQDLDEPEEESNEDETRPLSQNGVELT